LSFGRVFLFAELEKCAPDRGSAFEIALHDWMRRRAFFIMQIVRHDSDVFTAPPAATIVRVVDRRGDRTELLTSLFEPQVHGARG
jgi:hypothetical protein